MKIGQDLHANFKGFLVSNLTFLFCNCYISSFSRCPGVLTIDTNGTAPTSEMSGYWRTSDLYSNFGGNRRACSIIHQIVFGGFFSTHKILSA